LSTKPKTAKSDAATKFRYAAAYLVRAREAANARHMGKAEKAYNRARESLIAEAARVGKALREGLETQQRLVKEVSSGRISAEQANRQGRELSERLGAMRQQLADINALINMQPASVAATSPVLPLEEYARHIGTRPGLDLKPSRAGFIIWLMILITIGALGILYAGVIQLHAPVEMWVTPIQPGGPFTISVRNNGQTPARLAMPHTGSHQGMEGFYTLSVYVRTPEKEFRETPCLDCWVYRGATMNEPVQVSVTPGMSEQVTFRPARLRNWQINGDGLKFVLLGPAGEPVAEQAVNY
jgi:hypothetical protein